MELYDVEARRLAAAERTDALRRTASKRRAPGRAVPVRGRIGFWLVGLGLRIAADRPVPTGA